MKDMKWDMGGAGAVTGLMHALAARKAKVNAVGVCGLVENMPSGTAQRPGDVVTSMRSEEHTSELQSLMRISYAAFCLKKNMMTPYLPIKPHRQVVWTKSSNICSPTPPSSRSTRSSTT